jgi:hypothetical protein
MKNLILIFHKTTRHVLAASVLNSPPQDPTVEELVGSTLDLHCFAQSNPGANAAFNSLYLKIQAENLGVAIVTKSTYMRQVALNPHAFAAKDTAKQEEPEAVSLGELTGANFHADYNRQSKQMKITMDQALTTPAKVAIHVQDPDPHVIGDFVAQIQANGTKVITVPIDLDSGVTEALVLLGGYKPVLVSIP